MPINRLTYVALSHLGRLQNGEHIIDGAPARCRELDERNRATFEEVAGGIAGVRLWAIRQVANAPAWRGDVTRVVNPARCQCAATSGGLT